MTSGTFLSICLETETVTHNGHQSQIAWSRVSSWRDWRTRIPPADDYASLREGFTLKGNPWDAAIILWRTLDFHWTSALLNVCALLNLCTNWMLTKEKKWARNHFENPRTSASKLKYNLDPKKKNPLLKDFRGFLSKGSLSLYFLNSHIPWESIKILIMEKQDYIFI